MVILPLMGSGFSFPLNAAAQRDDACENAVELLAEAVNVDGVEDPCGEGPDLGVLANVVAIVTNAVNDLDPDGTVEQVNEVVQQAVDLADVCEESQQRADAADCIALVNDAAAQVTALLNEYLAFVRECTAGAGALASTSDAEGPVDCSEVADLGGEMVQYLLNTINPVIGEATACLQAMQLASTSSVDTPAGAVDCGALAQDVE